MKVNLKNQKQMRNRIKPIPDKQGFRRPCKRCDKYFQPVGKYQRLCDNCQKKSIKGHNAKELKQKPKKDV